MVQVTREGKGDRLIVTRLPMPGRMADVLMPGYGLVAEIGGCRCGCGTWAVRDLSRGRSDWYEFASEDTAWGELGLMFIS
jgi:hypothetical protein